MADISDKSTTTKIIEISDTLSIQSNETIQILRIDENIDIVETGRNITYNDFYTNYIYPNKPCLIKSSTNNWYCRQQWVEQDQPNFDYLDQEFGGCTVPVVDCDTKYYNSQLKNTMRMDTYLNYWKEYKKSNYSPHVPVKYLKDWHCVKDTNPAVEIYQTPKYFAADWLNEFYSSQPDLNDDYKFVYMGPRNSWTPLHVDVFSSYSWSANVVGKKRWLLFPPDEEKNLHHEYDIKSKDLQTVKHYNVIQETGDIIFVPSGWYHQVWNLEDTISINHNWINGCNVQNVWSNLKKELSRVMLEVDDCKDMTNWKEHCQLLLKVSYGIDYYLFFSFLSFIIDRRLSIMLKQKTILSFNKYQLGMNHCLFDLKSLRLVLNDFINDVQDKSIENIIGPNDRANVLLDSLDDYS